MDNAVRLWSSKRNFLLTTIFVATAGFIFLSADEAKAAVPFGYVDGVSQVGVISGWAIDPDSSGRHIEVHAYFDGPAGKSKTVVGSGTSYARCDVRYLQDIDDCGFHYGFDIQVPANLQDGREHKVYVYAIDANFDNFGQGPWIKTGASALLGGSPKSFRIGLSTNTPRHARGALIQDNGTIYFVGDQFRYPFPSAEVFLSWGVNFSQVVPANSGDLALPIGYIVDYKTQALSQPDVSNRLPIGRVDEVNGQGMLRGWTFDPDAPDQTLGYRIYIDGQMEPARPYYSDLAMFRRDDINNVYGVPGFHGIEFKLTDISSMTYGQNHTAYIYVIDHNDNSLFLLNGSPISFYLPALLAPDEDTTVLSHDYLRIVDIRAIQTALEIYYNDQQSYPSGTGLVLDSESLDQNGWTNNPITSTYIDLNGTPSSPEGSCTASQNDYTYTRTNSGSSYVISFCLGGSVPSVGLTAGVHQANPSGIN